jgi:GTPase SAR1 family protein
MDKSIQSIKTSKIFCKYCKRNFILAGLNHETQICFQCEEVFSNFTHSPQLIDGKIVSSDERNFLILKTIILGDIFSNKTQLFRNYVNNYLNHSYQQTIGLDIAGKDIILNNRHIRVTISIISHLKRFKIIRKEFYSGTNIAFLVFNSQSPDSIKEVETVWNQELNNYENRYINQAKIMKILVGNNWESSSNCILTENEISRFSKKLNCAGYMLCNQQGEISKSNVHRNMHNLHDTFLYSISQYLETYIHRSN